MEDTFAVAMFAIPGVAVIAQLAMQAVVANVHEGGRNPLSQPSQFLFL